MATSETNISFYCDTNTLIRAYCAFIKTQMLAMNWLQTSDTGQLDPTTVVAATALDQDLGYLMFKMNDSLQPTNPVFMKLIIGAIAAGSQNNVFTVGNTYNVVRIKIQVGTATNGAGTFTGSKVSQQRAMTYYSTSAGPTATSNPTAVALANLHLFSGDTNRILFMRGSNGVISDTTDPFTPTFPALGNCFRQQSYFSIERSKDAAGADSGDGIIFVAAGNMGESTYNPYTYFHEYIPFSRPIPQHRHKNFWPCFNLGDSSSLTSLNYNSLTAQPFDPYEGGQRKNPGLNQLGYWVNDFQYGGTTTPITMYGATHQYRPIPEDMFRTILGSASGMWANSRMMIRWE